MRQVFSCYIISETSLGIQCAEEIINAGHKLLGIVSPDINTHGWAINNNICYFSSITDFENKVLKSSERYDYLFSIVNSHILKDSVISRCNYYAINYHDAPLPRYAGANATSWAILNDEPLHGISWHIATQLIDGGDILKQSIFSIDSDETTLSLNLKCYIHALNTFKELIQDLSYKNVARKKQDLGNRSYYSLHQKPYNFGFVDWQLSAEEISKQHRALSFGDYPNTLVSFKILINDKIYIPGSLEILSLVSSIIPGTVADIADDRIQITTSTYNINFSDFRDLYGKNVDIVDIVKDTNITIGTKLRDCAQSILDTLEANSQNIFRADKLWKENTIDISPVQLTFLPYQFNSRHFIADTQSNYASVTEHWSETNNILKGQNFTFEDVLISIFLICLSKISDNNQFYVSFFNPLIKKLPKDGQELFCKFIPLKYNAKSSDIVSRAIEHTINNILKLEKYGFFCTKDIYVRHPRLRLENLSLQVIVNKGTLGQILEFLPKDHSYLIFNVNKDKGTYTIYGYNFSYYNTNGVIKKISEYIKILSNQTANFLQSSVGSICLLTYEEKKQIIKEWNQTDKEYPSDKTIHQLFEEQVERTPDSTAVVYEGLSLTYRELNERANRVANYLRSQQEIGPDSLIALCLDRSEYMIIAILGVLKAGGAYVPIDPSYPDERIGYILEDTKACVVITNEIHRNRLEQIKDEQQVNVVAIDSEVTQASLALQPTSGPRTQTISNNLAYVIYTSGTTGNPKGVQTEHNNVSSLVKNVNYINIGLTDSFIQLADSAFDATTFELWGPLLNGSKLIIPADVKCLLVNEQAFQKILTNYQISILWLTKTLFDQVFLSNKKIFKNLKYLLVGGEALNNDLIYDLINAEEAPEHVINGYGPTENCTFSCVLELNKDNILKNSTIPIGVVLSNRKAYVLNYDLIALPVGAVGELYVGGAGLARGYLNRPDLTAERFIANPFRTEQELRDGKNARLYKTGDLVRWLPDGNLEYIGRNDFQVKIRGYRIELGEVESALASYEGVMQVAVLAKERVGDDGSANKYLVGYYVAQGELDEDKMLSYLRSKLPEYMVPSALVQLEKMPLTINGKLDRKALPDPEFGDADSYVAPRNELEKKVCKIWAEVLGLDEDKVGIHDDFFRLGGNSIMAIRILSKLTKEFDKEISLSSIFLHPLVEQLANHLVSTDQARVTIGRIDVNDPKEQILSFAQERLWFIEQYEQGTNAYNIPMIFKLSEYVDLEILELGIRSIVERHEILRTLISIDEEGQGYQIVKSLENKPFEIYKIQVKGISLDQELSKEVNHVYDLSNEYPIRVCLYEVIDDITNNVKERYISIVIHHIAFDGWSSNIFWQELQEYYRYYKSKQKGQDTIVNLPELTIQYKDFALWQRCYLSGERLEQQLDYWRNKLAGYERLNLITDKPRPKQIDYTGSVVHFKLDKDLSHGLRELAKELNLNLYSVLLIGLAA